MRLDESRDDGVVVGFHLVAGIDEDKAAALGRRHAGNEKGEAVGPLDTDARDAAKPLGQKAMVGRMELRQLQPVGATEKGADQQR